MFLSCSFLAFCLFLPLAFILVFIPFLSWSFVLHFCLIFFKLVVLVNLVNYFLFILLIYFLSVLLFYLSPCLHWSNLCSCAALSCLVSVLLEFLSWPVPANGSSCLLLGLLHSLWSTSIWAQLYGALLGLLHLPGLSSGAILPVDVQGCPSGVPAVESPAHLITLLYLSVL